MAWGRGACVKAAVLLPVGLLPREQAVIFLPRGYPSLWAGGGTLRMYTSAGVVLSLNLSSLFSGAQWREVVTKRKGSPWQEVVGCACVC